MDRNIWIGLGILILVVLVAGYIFVGRGTPAEVAGPNPRESSTGTPASGSEPSPSGSPITTGVTKRITISGNEFAFTPAKITVNQGDNVVITFKNTGTMAHNLTFTDLNMATNTIAPGQSDTLEFNASEKGNFSFACTIDGHADRGMQGTLEVK